MRGPRFLKIKPKFFRWRILQVDKFQPKLNPQIHKVFFFIKIGKKFIGKKWDLEVWHRFVSANSDEVRNRESLILAAFLAFLAGKGRPHRYMRKFVLLLMINI